MRQLTRVQYRVMIRLPQTKLIRDIVSCDIVNDRITKRS